MALDWLFRKRRVSADDLRKSLSTLRSVLVDSELSLFTHIRNGIETQGSDFTGDSGLPDGEPEDTGGIRFSAGAMDGVMMNTPGAEDAPNIASDIFKKLDHLTRTSGPTQARAFYDLLKQNEPLHIVDPVIAHIVRWTIPAELVREIAVWLIQASPHRAPVKYGIALLGVCGTDADAETLATIGRHEEFTLYAAVALRHSNSDAEAHIWTLAKHLRGWGRVHCVHRLSETLRPDIRRWLLTEGCRNAVMPEYTALVCATTGGLAAALEAPSAANDDPLLQGAGEILRALLQSGGCAATIDEYADGFAAVDSYVRCVESRSSGSIDHIATINCLQKFLADQQTDWTMNFLAGWSGAERDRLATRCETLLARDWVRSAIEPGLISTASRDDFLEAAELAPIIGIDPWESRFARLRAGEDQWYWLLATEDPARVDRVLSCALETMPVHRLSAPPGLSILPTGPDAEHYRAIDWIVSALQRFPGRGWPFIRAALASPNTRNRTMGVFALAKWPQPLQDESILNALGHAASLEPDDELKQQMTALAKGRPLKLED